MASSIRSSNGLFPRRWEEVEVHVLAVDDSVVDRKVIERLLKITSCKVTTVESGWRALQYLGLDTPPAAAAAANHHHHHDFVNGLKVDLIITDYCMPGMTGYELLKKIKGSPTFRQVPVVIMSSENLVPRIHRCLEEGAEDFIVKPVKLSDVKRLKDYMFGDNSSSSSSRGTTTTNHINNNQQQQQQEEEDKTNKRKLQQMMSPPSTSLSPSSTPPMSPPFSPSQLQSPTSNSSSDDDHHHV